MIMSSAVKFFTNTNKNIAQLQNTFGCVIRVLDACLVNGVPIGTITSLTASGKIATAVFSANHNLMKHQVILVSGATQAEYNIESRVLSIPNATTITFQLNVTPSIPTATGTISAKLSSLDWEKPFSSTSATGGKAAYRSKNTVLSSRPYLRVVDELDTSYRTTYAKYAKVGIVEDMTNIGTMLGVQAPYNSATPNRNWVGTSSGLNAINGWSRWYYAGSDENYFSDSTDVPTGDRNWVLVGNGDYFYLFTGMVPASTNFYPYGFGAFKSLINTDTSNTFLSSTMTTDTASSGIFHADNIALGSSSDLSKVLLLRNYAQIARYVTGNCLTVIPNRQIVYSGTFDYIGSYTLANVAPFVPVIINETVLRGEIQGYYWLLQNKPYTHLQIIERDNEAFMAIDIGISTGYMGQVVVKIGDI